MAGHSDLEAARDFLAGRREQGLFTLPSATIQFAPLEVRLLSVDQDGSQAMIEYPGGVREVVHAAEIASLTLAAD